MQANCASPGHWLGVRYRISKLDEAGNTLYPGPDLELFEES